MEDILLLENPPIMMEAVWGNGFLAKKYNYKVKEGVNVDYTPIGACFSEKCIVKNGKYVGKTLEELYSAVPELFGNPIWEKLHINMACLYANESLSVQVHPREDWAIKNLNEHGKSECWYFVKCDNPTYVVLGHNATSMNELKNYIKNEDWDGLLIKQPVDTGSFYAIKAGTIHAVQKGCQFIEICNPSEKTYRFYDYNRIDKNGKKRKLDIEKALENILIPNDLIKYEKIVTINEKSKEVFLADNEDYSAWIYEVSERGEFKLKKPFCGGYVFEGNGRVNGYDIREGEIFMITNKCERIQLEGNMKIMCCYG